MSACLLDTNILVVANGRSLQANDQCRLGCVALLSSCRDGVVLLDALGLILKEYERHASHSGQPGLGDAFFKYLHENQGVAERCLKVEIRPDQTRGFEEFPDDPELRNFDPADRKFVAVALASRANPVIHNATDSDWRDFREGLKRHGVRVNELCPDCLRAPS